MLMNIEPKNVAFSKNGRQNSPYRFSLDEKRRVEQGNRKSSS
jgi:hypothetical protein